MKLILLVVISIWFGGMAYGILKPLPAGLALEGREHKVSEAEFLYDLTYERDNALIHEQRIFDRLLQEIALAERFIVLDTFLIEGVLGGATQHPPRAAALAEALIRKKRETPKVVIVVITDPINTCYDAYPAPTLDRLRSGGVTVITTELNRLRDSNPLYSGLWRPLLQWFGAEGRGWLPNPFSDQAPPVSLRTWLALLNFKANHRKVLITDQAALVASANLDDASAYHSNIALVVRGGIQNDLLESEAAVAALAGISMPALAVDEEDGDGPLTVQLLTEGAIKDHLLAALSKTAPGETIWLAMFYLSEREVCQALLVAARRGVTVRLILDPSKDAFGRPRSGIPNRQAAAWLVRRSGGKIAVRWYDTHGEQFHPKLVFIEGREQGWVLGGSANLTRRNLDNYNLETDLLVSGPAEAPFMASVAGLCRRLWENQGADYTLPFAAFREDSVWKRLQAFLQESSGMGTF